MSFYSDGNEYHNAVEAFTIKKCDKHYYYKDNIVLCQLRSASASEKSLRVKPSYENEVRLQVHFHANQTHSHVNGFAQTRFETEAHGDSEMAY